MAVLDVVVPVFAVVAVGWLLAHFRQFDLAAVTELLLFASLPALALHSLMRHRPDPESFAMVAGAALTVVAVVGILAWAASRVWALPTRGVLLTATFMNAGNFGLPFALLAWGEEGLAYAILYYLTMAVTHGSIGLWVARGGASGWREIFRLPLIYAAVLGLVLAWVGVELPPIVARPLKMLGDTAIPLMLISLGYTLRNIRPGALRPAAVAVLLRMGGGFAVALAVVTLTDISGVMRNVVLLSSSMPAAVMNIVLARRYSADADVVATAVLLSTAVATVSVPLLLAWLG